MRTALRLTPWYWQQVPIQSQSPRGQTVQQLYTNTQELDAVCTSGGTANGSGQTASVFLLSRRPGLGLLEGRMISTQSGNWFGTAPASGSEGTGWSTSETLLFSIPFTGLQQRNSDLARRPEHI